MHLPLISFICLAGGCYAHSLLPLSVWRAASLLPRRSCSCSAAPPPPLVHSHWHGPWGLGSDPYGYYGGNWFGYNPVTLRPCCTSGQTVKDYYPRGE